MSLFNNQKKLLRNQFTYEMLREQMVLRSMPLWVYAVAFFAPLIIISAAVMQPWVPVDTLFEDPLTVAQRSVNCCHFYYGAVSNLGVLVWWGTSAICLFSAMFLFNSQGPSEQFYFLCAAGLLTGLLTLDELYLLHSNFMQALGVPKVIIYGLYSSLCFALVLRFISLITDHDLIAYLIAGGLLALSVVIDNPYWGGSPATILLEDAAKFCGISFWSAFHISASISMCKASSTSPTRSSRT